MYWNRDLVHAPDFTALDVSAVPRLRASRGVSSVVANACDVLPPCCNDDRTIDELDGIILISTGIGDLNHIAEVTATHQYHANVLVGIRTVIS